MSFKDVFREKYRAALAAARADSRDGVITALDELCSLFSEQFGKDNGDPIVVKAKLSYWQSAFHKYAQIVRQCGLSDRRIQKLFGFIDDDTLPSLSDILSGEGNIDASPVSPPSGGSIDISGILGQEPNIPEPPAGEELPRAAEPINGQAAAAPDAPPVALERDAPADPDAVEENGGGEDAPVFAPNSLRGFIGQQHIVKALLKEIAIVKNNGLRHLDNILLFGNPGLGKSTLMELIAKELGVRFEKLDCSQFRNSQQSLKALQGFFMRVARENEPVVIALDEIHALTAELQSSLLTLLNDRVYVSPPDIGGNIKRIPIEDFTFIGATTDDDKVLDTIKNRCLRLTFQMTDYAPEELRRIYKNKIASKGLTVDDEVIEISIPRSRGAIRYVNSIVDGFDRALYDDCGVRISTHIDLSAALKYFDEKGIDSMGLTAKDLEILNVLDKYAGDAMGVDVLSARVGLDTKKYISEYEKYLIKIGFINVSGKGRALTETAVEYLHR